MCSSGNLYECQEEWEIHWAKQALERKNKTVKKVVSLKNSSYIKV